MTEAEVVNRLKAELKRSLRSHVAQAVNDVCRSFADELKPPESSPPAVRPQVGVSAYETDYDCCRRLVEYIVRNMDTSPGFVQQMDCIILAYQSNAPVEVLNSVVKQNLWFHRKYVGDKAGAADDAGQEKAVKTADAPLKKDAKELVKSHDRKKSVGAVGSKGEKVVSEVAKAKPAVRLGDDKVDDDTRLKNVPAQRKTSKADATDSEVAEAKCRLDGAVTDSTASGVLPRPNEKAPQPALEMTKSPQLGGSKADVKTDSQSTAESSNGAAVSLPREWGRRKRLVTRKRPKAKATPSKRARREHPSLDQSSTESDNSEGGVKNGQRSKYSASKDDVKKKKAEPTAFPTTTQETIAAAKNEKATGNNVLAVDIASTTTQDATQETNTDAHRRKDIVTPVSADMSKVAQKAVIKTAKTTVPARKRRGNTVGIRYKSDEEEKQDAGSSTETDAVDEKRDQSGDNSLVDVELRKMAKDLEAGDEVYGLQVAKVRFQSMLDSLVGANTEDSDTSASKADDNALATADPIAKLCGIKKRSIEQNNEFKTRLRDTIEIVDASLCKPPPGHTCSRDCKSIRAQLCNEFTPCINPTCHAWHDAETHSETCPNEKCEFKTRVTLRETMHLIEHKQQEITSASDVLKRAKADLLSPTRRSNQERVSVGNAEAFKRIETLEHDLENLNGELLILLDTKLQHWATLSSIGIDTQSDKLDKIPDFATHYTTRSHQRKKL